MNKQVKIFQTSGELNDFAAGKFAEIADDAIEMRGSFYVALAGGSTPKSVYRLLAGDKFRDKIDWRKVFFFFGDERNVPPTHAESNFRMAKENLFEPLQIPVSNIERWKTEYKNVGRIVESYEERLRLNFALAADNEDSKSVSSESEEEKRFPRFDLILLGMGADGHTASLFPFTEALHETEKPAVANYVEKLNDWRFTLTFPVINNARNVIFLVAGNEKAETLRAVLDGEFVPEKLPSQNVTPEKGNLFWLADAKAASLLQKPTSASGREF
jgi:6-phosphogluconolactonase